MKILFVTDTRIPFLGELEKRGHEILVVDSHRSLKKVMKYFQPDDIHIMTRGPISFFARLYFVRKKIPFKAHFLSLSSSEWYLRYFYAKAEKIFTPSKGAKNVLMSYGIKRPIELLPPGIDEHIHSPLDLLDCTEKPIFVYQGKLTPSSGALEFCELNLPGTKIIITSDPLKGAIFRKYSSKIFFYPEDPALMKAIFNQADVLVIPQTKEIFPSSLIEANAQGIPIASRPIFGVKEYIRNGQNGYMSCDLQSAALRCLTLDKQICINIAKPYTASATVGRLMETVH